MNQIESSSSEKATQIYKSYLFVHAGKPLSEQTYKSWFESTAKKYLNTSLTVKSYRHISNAWMEKFCPADSEQIQLLYAKQAGREIATAKNWYSTSNLDLENVNRIDYMQDLSSSRSWQNFLRMSGVNDALSLKNIADSSTIDTQRPDNEYLEKFISMSKQGYIGMYSLVETLRSGMPGTVFVQLTLSLTI